MAPIHRTAILLWSLSWLLSLFLVVGAQEHQVTFFHNLPARLFFFDDQPVRNSPFTAHSSSNTTLYSL